MLKRLLLANALILVCAVAALAQQLPPQMLWNHNYGTVSYADCEAIQQTTDGGFILFGHNYTPSGGNCRLVKTDALGQQQWARNIGGSQWMTCMSGMQTSDGGYILGGYWSNSTDTRELSMLIKTDENGDSLWSRIYVGDWSNCQAVRQTADGGYILACTIWLSGGSSNSDGLIIKTDANGDTLWTRQFGGSTFDSFKDIRQTSDGGYIVAGTYGSSNPRFWLVKVSANGDSLWSQTYSSYAEAACKSVVIDEDGGYVVAGNAFIYDDSRPLVMKTNSEGQLLWNLLVVPSEANCWCMDLVETWDHRYVVAGMHSGDQWLAKIDSDGDSLWSKSFTVAGYEGCYSVCQTTDGGFALAGNYLASYYNFYLMRTGPDYVGVTCDLMPQDPPIQIPPSGGSFQFDVRISNYSDTVRVVDAWIIMTLPNGIPFPITTHENLNLPVGANLMRSNLTQIIPGTAMPGTYHYVSHVRDHATFQVLAADSFAFLKLPGTAPAAHDQEWALLGWEEELVSAIAKPTQIALHPVQPNPFNSLTTIQFELRDAAHIKLKIYDTTGRPVSTLVDGWRNIGSHEATFDGSTLASGVYIYNLQAGGFQAAGKMLLLK
jgi:hypothetical protein